MICQVLIEVPSRVTRPPSIPQQLLRSAARYMNLNATAAAALFGPAAAAAGAATAPFSPPVPLPSAPPLPPALPARMSSSSCTFPVSRYSLIYAAGRQSQSEGEGWDSLPLVTVATFPLSRSMSWA